MRYIAYIDNLGMLERIKIKDDPNLRGKVTFVQQLAARGRVWLIEGAISSDEVSSMFNHSPDDVSVYEAYDEPRDPSEPHIGSALVNYPSPAGEKSAVQSSGGPSVNMAADGDTLEEN